MTIRVNNDVNTPKKFIIKRLDCCISPSVKNEVPIPCSDRPVKIATTADRNIIFPQSR